MALNPEFFKPYHLSDIAQGAIFEDGERKFRGYGSDTTDSTENVIYIGAPALERAVALKAFIESYKLNLTKETDIKKEGDKQSHMYTEYTSDLSFDLTLNIPAHSTNESRNNIAKLEELQRLITPMNMAQTNASYGTKNNYFCVWFKNLIHSGRKYYSYPSPSSITFLDLMKHGFFCYIEGINYEPDMDAGFFEFDDIKDGHKGAFLFPRNIKLSLSLKFGVEFEEDKIRDALKADGITPDTPLYSFDTNGNYDAKDNGRFPFGLYTIAAKDYEEVAVTDAAADYTNDNMNEIDYRLQGGGSTSKNSFLFISIGIKEDLLKEPEFGQTSKRKRWVKFKGFIESFNRDVKVNIPLKDGNKARTLGKPMDFERETTFEALDYSMKITVPSSDLGEAKKNCAKIQYLLRMFFKSSTPATLSHVRSTDTSASKHSLKFYSPSFIEGPNTTTYYANDFGTMYDNALNLFLIDLGIDIDIEAGFFEEDGYLWPKVFSVDLKMSDMSGGLIKNYTISPDGDAMMPSTTFPGKEHLFPFPRQTSKIIIGGN